MNRILGLATFCGIALAMAGCGGDSGPTTTVDAGTDMTTNSDGAGPDMPRTDSGRDMTVSTTLPTCASPNMVSGVLDTTSTVMVDTTGGPVGPLTLTDCGSSMQQIAPQAVIAFVVPGTGDVTVDFTTDTEGTAAEVDTIVEVINGGACTDEPVDGSGCFDDIDYPSNVLSGGSVTSTGGATIYFVVTGYGDSAGPIQLDIHPYVNMAPTMSALSFNIGTIRALFQVTGADANGNADHINATLLNGEGAGLDVNDDGMVDATDTVSLGFDDTLSGMTSFSGTVSLHGRDIALLRGLGAASVRVTLADSAGAESAPMTVGVTTNGDSIGDACSESAPCGDLAEIICMTGTCASDPAVTTACSTTTPIVVPTPASGESTSTMVSGTTGAPPASLLGGTCQSGHLTPTLYTVSVPEGSFDLIVTTIDPTPPEDGGVDGMFDTIVSIRTTCTDVSTEVACNDDTSDSTASQAIVQNVVGGSYTILVDQYSGSTPPTEGLAFGLNVSLRSVVGAGEACDPTGVMNRCSTGTCPGAGDGDAGVPVEAVCPPAVSADAGVDLGPG